ncbi:MAG: head-tail adaptor protein [Sphingomonadaceae bacterium]|nr:head-tail adaptor protein [Sphingomonadaceae bacterium]
MAELAGALRERIAIERWDGTGWIAIGDAWAALAPVDTVLTADVGERQLGRPRFRLTVRTPTVVALATRCRWRGRLLVVLRAEPDPALRDRATFLVEDRT